MEGEAPLFFGHASACVRGHRAREFDPAVDILRLNVVALNIADEDAEVWGRRFDIALVQEVLRDDQGVHFRVRYYDAAGVQPGAHSLLDPAFYDSEEIQIQGRWVLGRQEGIVRSQDVMCESWVQKSGPEKGLLHREYKRRLVEEVERHGNI